jgi:AcrR family transcriptional regulator
VDNEGMSNEPTEPTVKRRRAATVHRPYGGVHADTRRLERRTRLMAAGLEVIGTRGYHQSTIRDICAESGLSERYFYESFKGMALMFEAIYAELHTESQSRVMGAFVTASAGNADPMRMAEAAITAWLSFLKEDVRRARILLIDAVSVNDLSQRNAQAAIQDFAGIIRAFVEMLYPSLGQLGYDSKMLAATLAGANLYAAKQWMWSDFAQPVEEVASHLTLVFRSLHDFYVRETKASGKMGTSKKP